MDTIVASITAIWVALLAWLSQIILPNWNDVLRWIPSLLLGLVGLVIAVLVARLAAQPPSDRFTHDPGPPRGRATARRPHARPVASGRSSSRSGWPSSSPPSSSILVTSSSPVINGGQVVTEAAPPDHRPRQPAAPAARPGHRRGGVVGWYRDAGREWHHVEDPAWHPAGLERRLGRAAAARAPAGRHAPARSQPVAVPRAAGHGRHLLRPRLQPGLHRGRRADGGHRRGRLVPRRGPRVPGRRGRSPARWQPGRAGLAPAQRPARRLRHDRHPGHRHRQRPLVRGLGQPGTDPGACRQPEPQPDRHRAERRSASPRRR